MDTKVWAVTMMKDEADVAYHSVMHMSEEGVDGIIVADNMSSDNTRMELFRAQADAKCPVIINIDNDPAHYQGRKMSALANEAHTLGADWIIPFDADELWWSDFGRLAVVIRESPGTKVHYAKLINHYPHATDDTTIANPFKRIRWREDHYNPIDKVAFRWTPDASIAEGNHSVTSHRLPQEEMSGKIKISHFPIRSYEQFCSKARNGYHALRATNLSNDVGSHWRQWGKMLEDGGPDALRELFVDHPNMIEQPAPFRSRAGT